MVTLPDNFLLENNGIYICLGTVLGSIITGFLLTLNNSRNNEFQLKRENQQRIFQQKSEQQKWYRERIYDSYRKAIYLLTEMMQMQFEAEKNYVIENKEIRIHKLSLELMSEFDIIVHSYLSTDFEDKDFEKNDSKRFQEKINEFNELLNINPLEARSILTEMMENDSRIKNIN